MSEISYMYHQAACYSCAAFSSCVLSRREIAYQCSSTSQMASSMSPSSAYEGQRMATHFAAGLVASSSMTRRGGSIKWYEAKLAEIVRRAMLRHRVMVWPSTLWRRDQCRHRAKSAARRHVCIIPTDLVRYAILWRPGEMRKQ